MNTPLAGQPVASASARVQVCWLSRGNKVGRGERLAPLPFAPLPRSSLVRTQAGRELGPSKRIPSSSSSTMKLYGERHLPAVLRSLAGSLRWSRVRSGRPEARARALLCGPASANENQRPAGWFCALESRKVALCRRLECARSLLFSLASLGLGPQIGASA